MNTELIQYLIAAVLIGLAVILWLRRRARHLLLRIEHVPLDRMDNSPVERNEIVSPVRVRKRDSEQENSRIEPTVDGPANMPSVEEPSPVDQVVLAESETPEPAVLTFYPSVEHHAAMPDNLIEPPEALLAEPPPALTQEDLFPPDDEAAQASIGGLDESELAFERVLSIHVMARDAAIPGRLLLEHLLQYGLRYGDMAIFHRHEHPTGQGAILFSLAQAMEPGSFDIDSLSRDTVPGVSLFLGLPGYKSLVAFDLMIDTARRLSVALAADMLDDQGQVLSAGKIADWRDDVVAFDNRT